MAKKARSAAKSTAAVVELSPYEVEVQSAEKGMDIVARVAAAPGSTDVTTYNIHLPWNGWVAIMLRSLADVVAKKVNL